ncbi:t-SNARE, partial [Cantharellus anzutake]|uniref:t-SNARE n=1 Tax=Cantharellus anzutake TaxID=1750568 RepID=UPI001906C431
SSEPTTRSRTLLFLSYRDSDGRSRRPRNRRSRALLYSDADVDGADERQGLIAGDASRSSDHVILNMDPLPPKWVDISGQVEEILNGASLKISTLEKLHTKHALPGFADRSAEEREIERLTQEITRDFRQSQNLIQRISVSNTHAFPPTSAPSKDEKLAAKNVQRGLAAKLQELSGRFRKKQRVYMEKLQGHAIKNQDLLIASGVISSKGIDKMNEVEDDMQASRSQLSAQEQQTASPELEQRNREIAEIAKSITQLADIFKDLQNMVIDQGTILDSIEYNVEQTSRHVSEAVKELDIATKYQRNTGRRKCIFLLILIIFGLVIVLIFKPRHHS